MAKMVYQIGSREFGTQAEARKFVRAMLCRLGRGTVVASGPDFDFLLALFDRHPEREEKYGAGVRAFRVDQVLGNLAFHILRVDGTNVDASFIAAISGKGNTVEQNLSDAMRQAVSPQIEAFAETYCPGMKCGLCAEALERDGMHVDHVTPFRQMAQAFLAMYRRSAGGCAPVPTMFDDGPSNAAVFRREDHEFAAAWVEHHRKEALLRLVHARCNLSRKRA